MTSADVLIIGGGVAGTVAALALADGRRRIIILESSGDDGPRFAGEFIQPLGVDLLARLGALERVRAAGAMPIQGMALFVDPAAANNIPILLPYSEIGRHEGAGRSGGIAMHCCSLVRALREEVMSRENVRFYSHTRVVHPLWNDGRVTGVRDAEGVDWTAPLTLVAQGRYAPLRQALGFAGKPQVLSLAAGIILEKGSLPIPGYAHIFVGTGDHGIGPLIALPIGPESIRISVDLPRQIEHDSLAERILAQHVKGLPTPFVDALREAMHRERPEVRANCCFQTTRCAGPGVALIGDAAGCTHPVTGAGMMTGLVDAWILREQLNDISFGDSPASDEVSRLDAALSQYQWRRYHFGRPREVLAKELYEVFCGANSATREMRRTLHNHWHSNQRSRVASLKLLTGDSSCLRTLCSEYLQVSGWSVLNTLCKPRSGSPEFLNGLRERLTTTSGIFQRSFQNLRICASSLHPETLHAQIGGMTRRVASAGEQLVEPPGTSLAYSLRHVSSSRDPKLKKGPQNSCFN